MLSSRINKVLHYIDPSLAPSSKTDTNNQHQNHGQPMHSVNQQYHNQFMNAYDQHHHQGQNLASFGQHHQNQPTGTSNYSQQYSSQQPMNPASQQYQNQPPAAFPPPYHSVQTNSFNPQYQSPPMGTNSQQRQSQSMGSFHQQHHSQPANMVNQQQQSQPLNSSNQQQHQSQPTNTYSQHPPTQSHTAPSSEHFAPQILAITKTKAIKKGKTLSSSANTPLYTLNIQKSKPHLQFFRAENTTDPFASATLHKLTSRIDITLPTSTVSLTRPDKLSSTYAFSHPTYGAFKWKPKSSSLLSSQLELVDGQGTVVARYNTSLPKGDWWKDKKGFEMLVGMHAELRDLVVVTGWAVVEAGKKEDEAIGKAVEKIASGGF